MGPVTVDTGLSYIGGEYIIVSLDASPSDFDIAQVTSYNSSTGVMEWNNVSQSTVSSFSSNWNINLTGIPGLKGDQGAQGEVGETGLKGEVGETGAKGEIGIQGATGEAGGCQVLPFFMGAALPGGLFRGNNSNEYVSGQTGSFANAGSYAPTSTQQDISVASTEFLYVIAEHAEAGATLSIDDMSGNVASYTITSVNWIATDATIYLSNFSGDDFNLNGGGFSTADFDTSGNPAMLVTDTGQDYRICISANPGAKGDQGTKGEVGEKGDVGPEGLTAYQVAVINGYNGDEASWLLYIEGEDGAKVLQVKLLQKVKQVLKVKLVKLVLKVKLEKIQL